MKTQLFLLIVAAIVIGCGSNHKGVIEASGTLEATEVKVSAKVPGQIESIRVQEGSQVQAGDTLIVLDRSTLELQFRQAQAGFEVADAQYRLLINGARSEDIRLGEESLRQAEASFKNASDDYARMKELLSSNTITRKQFDDAESRYTIAKAQLSSAEQGVAKLRKFARPEDLTAARARASQAQATSDLLKKQLTDAVVVAPVAGTVTHIPVEQGELMSMGSVAAAISRLDKMNLMIYVNETELGKAKLGGMADVYIDTYPDKPFPAKVVYISPIAEFTPKNVQTKEDRTKLVFGVKLEIENKEGVLKSGMPADAYVR
ncbi:MAG: efflux RND transporter periplasmic adaptor subunit [Ignavibacteriales bacterium]|nr:efflux RND transporter periplasmic adaptor subunit [Ignavibacteriales bacterium]